jgi:hypothetical protein
VRLLPGAALVMTAALALCGSAADQPAVQSPIRLPDSPPVPSPMPAPAPRPAPVLPGAPLKVTPELLYVFDSDVDVIVLTSPPGLATVSHETGPIKIHGRFAEQPDRAKMRTFRGKHVYTLEVLGTGRVEILVIPVGAKDDKAVVRRLVDVQTAPQPPPDPDPDKPIKSFRVVLIHESADTLTQAQRGVLYGAQVEEWLNANCTQGRNGWRRRDKDAPGTADPVFAPLWDAVKGKVTATPCVAVAVERDRDDQIKVDLIPLEKTPEEMIAVLTKYRGK